MEGVRGFKHLETETISVVLCRHKALGNADTGKAHSELLRDCEMGSLLFAPCTQLPCAFHWIVTEFWWWEFHNLSLLQRLNCVNH